MATKSTTADATVVEETKKTTKKAATKKTAEKDTAKTTVKRTRKAKAANIFVQYNNQEVSQEELVKRIIEKWCAENDKKESAIKEFDVYVKPEDNAAYYVVNGQGSSIELF